MGIIEAQLPDQPLSAARLVMSCTGSFDPDSPVQVRNTLIVDEWLVWLRDVAGRTEGTVRSYAGVAAKFLDLCVGDRPLGSVPVEDIERWSLRGLGGRARGQQGQPATRSRNLTIIRTMYKWLVARGYLDSNPAELVVTPTVHNREPKAISDAVWKSVWPLALTGDVPVEVPIILGLGFFFGLRRHEIVTLRRENVDEAGRLVGFTRKGGGEDTFPAAEVLEVWTAKRPDLFEPWTAEKLWGFFVARSAALPPHGLLAGLDGSGPYGGADLVNKRLGRFLAGVGAEGSFTPHGLRHSFVTNMLRMGMPIEMVSELANHSDLSVTMRYRKGGGGMVTEWLRSS